MSRARALGKQRKPAVKFIAWASLILPLSLAISTTLAAPVAPTYTVNDTADLVGAPPLDDGHCAAANGQCTLRAAIMEADHTSGGATILVPAGSYVLTSTVPLSNGLDISTTVTILGAGAGRTIVDANGSATFARAFVIDAGAAVTISGVTIQHGNSTSTGGGLVNLGQLLLDSSAVLSNTTNGNDNGGGISNFGGLTLRDSLLQGNVSAGFGGALFTQNGTAELINSTVFSNSAANGGGIAASSGIVTVTNSLIRDNLANGDSGGISNRGGQMTLMNSTVSGNQAGDPGGGLGNFSGAVYVYSSTIAGNTGHAGGGIESSEAATFLFNTTLSGNTSHIWGGGLDNEGGAAVLVNSTVSGNMADTDGGGIWNGSSHVTSSVYLYNVTVANNYADADHNGDALGGGLFNSSLVTNVIDLHNSLVDGNFNSLKIGQVRINWPNDCHGTLSSFDYNLVSVLDNCSLSAGSHDQVGVSARLGPLQDNGGPAQTQALPADSPALNAGNPAGCANFNTGTLLTDQRGFLRPATGVGPLICDIGAFEFQRSLLLPLVRR